MNELWKQQTEDAAPQKPIEQLGKEMAESLAALEQLLKDIEDENTRNNP